MSSPALDVALAYYNAWSSKNIDEAVSYFADDFVSQTPEGPKDAAAYRKFLDDYCGILVKAELVGAYGEDDTALMYYDSTTGPVPYVPAADWFRVRDGKIVELRIVFDQLTLNGAKAIAAVS
jgi:ketosteroid isomerase-like protein